MTPLRGDLLQPSLGADAGRAPPKAPYSAATSFLSAFFGGPYALLIVGALNVHRCGRWRQDAAVLSGLLLAALAWTLWLPHAALFPPMQAAVTDALGPRSWRYAERAFSLLLCGLLYWRHRSLERAAVMFGLRRSNGLAAGIAAIVVGNALSVLLPALLDADMR